MMLIGLFVLSLFGGLWPLLSKQWNNVQMSFLLAFSGSFLLSVTLVHLLPESFQDLGQRAGWLLLLGFFFQFFIQKITHGAEHGHAHIGHDHAISFYPILLGMIFHAFMEGVPLGFQYRHKETASAMALAVAAHKLPEAMLITVLALAYFKTKKKALACLILFAAVSPLSAYFANFFGEKYFTISQVILYSLPVMAGAFIHISTTILFESSTSQHKISWWKVLSVALGLAIGLLTLHLGHTHH